jgi:phage terminase large subunit GpA-like protein
MNELVKGFYDGLRPIARLTVSDWSDQYRYLSPNASAEPGLFRTSRTPYLKEIMDRLSSNDITQEVVVMKGAQLGFTEAGNNWVGYIIDISPAPTLMVMPTDDTVKRNSKIRIDPMIEATPRLREKISPSRSRDSGNTTKQKDFPGGVLVLTGANSAVGLRSMPVKYLFLDEVDGYPLDLEGEGSPIDLARARTRTFARKKIFIVSTPTIEGQSVVEKEFSLTDQRKFHVPCPHCGGMQELVWDNLTWEQGKPDTARYICVHCEEAIEERHKTAMLAGGVWIADAPDNTNSNKVGYHINSLYSPFGWYSWAQAASDYEDAENDENKLRTFTNTVLGETWKEKGDAPDWENIFNRRETYTTNTVPLEVGFITAGVDIQKDRIELEIVGWCRGKRTYSLDYRVIVGDTEKPEVWAQLSQVVNETWEREDKAVLPLRLMAIDTGYNTQFVYEFCRKFDPTRVMPVKGQDAQAVMIASPRTVDVNWKGRKSGTIQLWNIGVSLIKSETYGYLRLNRNEDGSIPNGYCHFPQYNPDYFKGITAEQLTFKVVRGYKRYQWEKKYERNEPLDCRVYARAAAAVVGVDRFEEKHWQLMEGTYGKAPRKDEKPKKRKSDFWNR